MGIEIIEHTADLRLRASGKTFPGTILGLSNFMLELIYGRVLGNREYIESSITFRGSESCVVRFLNDLLLQSESKGLAIRVRRVALSRDTMKWEGFGEEMDGKKHKGRYVVKAATYDRVIATASPPFIEITLDI